MKGVGSQASANFGYFVLFDIMAAKLGYFMVITQIYVYVSRLFVIFL